MRFKEVPSRPGIDSLASPSSKTSSKSVVACLFTRSCADSLNFCVIMSDKALIRLHLKAAEDLKRL